MLSIGDLSRSLRRTLCETTEEAAHAHGCVQRKRAFDGATLLQTVILGFLENPDATLRDLCVMAQRRGVTISPQGMSQRFSKELALALQTVLQNMIRTVMTGAAVEIPLLQRFGEVWILDATTIGLPAELADQWRGCGGRVGQGEAAVKVVVELDLVNGTLNGPMLQDGRAQDRSSPLATHRHHLGSLMVRDLGFFRLATLKHHDAHGEYWLSRLMAGTRVTTVDGCCLSQADLFAAQREAVVDMPVTLGVNTQTPARLLAARVPDEIARLRRERMEHNARRKVQQVSQERLDLADWTILITNVPPARLHLDEALALYRARWHIEQLFDLWKTVGGLDRSRSRQPWRVLAEVYAKLIAVVLQHWCILQSTWNVPQRSLFHAARIVRKEVGSLALELDHARKFTERVRVLSTLLKHSGCLNSRKTAPNLNDRLLDPHGTADPLGSSLT